MKKPLVILLVAAVSTLSAKAVLVNFTYTQNDASGSGSVTGFSYDNGGGPINFGVTQMTAATVVNPVPGATPAGFVGAMNATTGNSNETNAAVGLTWSGFVLATGTRGAQTYTMQIPFLFVPKQTQAPDINDYNWSVAFGDSATADTVSNGALRFAMYFSRDTVIDNLETSDTFQRYTQQNLTFLGGLDSFLNTDLSSAPLKDATDPAGAPAGVDAAGRDLAFYWGWRDTGSLASGAILVDTFTVSGLLNADESTLTLVPEPSAMMTLLLAASGLLLRRRR